MQIFDIYLLSSSVALPVVSSFIFPPIKSFLGTSFLNRVEGIYRERRCYCRDCIAHWGKLMIRDIGLIYTGLHLQWCFCDLIDVYCQPVVIKCLLRAKPTFKSNIWRRRANQSCTVWEKHHGTMQIWFTAGNENTVLVFSVQVCVGNAATEWQSNI